MRGRYFAGDVAARLFGEFSHRIENAATLTQEMVNKNETQVEDGEQNETQVETVKHDADLC